MENESAKNLIDYYKRLNEYIKNLEAKKLEVEESLNSMKEKLNSESPEEAGIFEIEGDEEDA